MRSSSMSLQQTTQAMIHFSMPAGCTCTVWKGFVIFQKYVDLSMSRLRSAISSTNPANSTRATTECGWTRSEGSIQRLKVSLRLVDKVACRTATLVSTAVIEKGNLMKAHCYTKCVSRSRKGSLAQSTGRKLPENKPPGAKEPL